MTTFLNVIRITILGAAISASSAHSRSYEDQDMIDIGKQILVYERQCNPTYDETAFAERSFVRFGNTYSLGHDKFIKDVARAAINLEAYIEFAEKSYSKFCSTIHSTIQRNLNP